MIAFLRVCRFSMQQKPTCTVKFAASSLIMAPGVRKCDRTVDTYLTMLTDAGFVLMAIKEAWGGLELRPKLEEEGEAH